MWGGISGLRRAEASGRLCQFATFADFLRDRIRHAENRAIEGGAE
jgi:hypothetical protein